MRLLSTALWSWVAVLPVAVPSATADPRAETAVIEPAIVPADLRTQPDGWQLLATATRASALAADRHDRPEATLLLQAHRWARLMAQTEAEACRDWIDALRAEGVSPRIDATDFRVRERTLSQIVSPALAGAMFADPARTALFFDAWSPTDNVVRVLESLAAIEQADHEHFFARFELALAIAVVFDAPPRADWPHAQVNEVQLPRRWPDPLEAFRFWAAEDRAGRLVYPLETLSVAQLVHIVDASATFDELRWAQQFGPSQRTELDAAALLRRVPYRAERVARGEFQWSWPDYRLTTILATGGICTEQAYFALQVLKSRGIPSALLSGTGREGRHAWIGYQFDASGRWRLDVGKNVNADVFNTVAVDPRTWGELDEWQMLRRGDPYESDDRRRQAATQAAFASLWQTESEPELALRSAQRAVGIEPQRELWWRRRLELQRSLLPDNEAGRETILREALSVKWSDPAIEGRFVASLAQMYEARGDMAAAASEWERFGGRIHRWRLDQQLDASRTMIAAEVGQGRASAASSMVRKVVAERGRTAGVALLDRLLYPLVEQLRAAGHGVEAAQLLEQTRTQLGRRVPAVARELERQAQQAKLVTVSDVR